MAGSCSRPAAMWSATWAAVRLPLNLSGATRTFTVVVPSVRCGLVSESALGDGGLVVEAVPVVLVVGDDRLGCFELGLPERGVAELGHGFLVQHRSGPVDVEGLGPAADEQGGDGVAAEVHQGPAFGHELVDAEDQHDAVGRDV